MKKTILSIAFVVLGTFTFAQQTEIKKMEGVKPSKAQLQSRQEEKLKELKTQLGLSDDQVSKIKALNDKKMEARKQQIEQGKADRAQKMQEMKSKKEEYDNEMKQILTTEQYKKWESVRAEKMQEKKEQVQQRKAMKSEQTETLQQK